MQNEQPEASQFYTGLVARLYTHLRSEVFDPQPYRRFVTLVGGPALELGCGDGDPLLDLRADGLNVEGLDSSADMLDRCRAAAAARGLDVVLHHATFESMDLGRKYRSMYLAGCTFNLLPDDATARSALQRIAAHLEPGGSVLIPLFIPLDAGADHVGWVNEKSDQAGLIMRLTVMAFTHDVAAREQTTRLRYELIDETDVQSLEREWTLHWFSQQQFASMATDAGLTVHRVLANDGARATAEDTGFTFWLRLDEAGQPPSS